MIIEKIVSGDCPIKFKSMTVVKKADVPLHDVYGLVEAPISKYAKKDGRYYIIYDDVTMQIFECIDIRMMGFDNDKDALEHIREMRNAHFDYDDIEIEDKTPKALTDKELK